MAKPNKNTTYKVAKKLLGMGRAWSAGGQVVREFMPANEDGHDENSEFAKVLKARMKSVGFDPVRENLGGFLFACMLGMENEDKTPTYTITDVMAQGKFLEEKKNLVTTIENLLAPLKQDAKEADKKAYEERVRKVDAMLLRGIKRMSNRLSEITSENVKNNNIAGFITPEVQVLSSVTIPMLTNFVDDCYTKTIKKNELKPGSYIDRLSRKVGEAPKEGEPDTRLTLEETILGKGESYKALADKNNGMTGFIKDYLSAVQQIEDTMENGAALDFRALAGYISFDILVKKAKAKPNTPIEELFPNKSKEELAELKAQGRKVKVSELTLYDYSNGLTSTIDDFKIKVNGGGWDFWPVEEIVKVGKERDYPNRKNYINAYKNMAENNDNPIYRYGYNMMLLNGTMFENFKYSLGLKFKEKGSPDFVSAKLNFKDTLNPSNVYKAAFLSDMSLDGFYDNQEKDTQDIKELGSFLEGKLLEYRSVTGNDPAPQLVDFAGRINTLAAEFEKEEDFTTVKKHQDLKQKFAEAVAAFETVKAATVPGEKATEDASALLKEISDKLDASKNTITAIGEKVNYRTALYENGALLGALKDDGTVQSMKEIAEQRTELLKEFKKKFESLEPRGGASKEWRHMRDAIENAERISQAFSTGGASLEQLNNAMNMVRYTAVRYVRHKVEDKNATKGSDFERLQNAKKLETMAKQQCDYVGLKLARAMTSVHEENGYLSKESVIADMNKIGDFRQALKGTRSKLWNGSKEFKEMISYIDKLLIYQDKLNKKNGAFDEDDDRKYYGYDVKDVNGTKHINGFLDDAIESVRKYITHKLSDGDFKGVHGTRIDIANSLRTYLMNVKEGARRNNASRYEGYERAKENKRLAEEAKRRTEAANATMERTNTENINKLTKDVTEAKTILRTISNEIQNDKSVVINKDTKIPEDKVPQATQAVYVLIAYNKFVVANQQVKSKIINEDNQKIVDLVKAGKFEDVIKMVKDDEITAKEVTKDAAKYNLVAGITKDENLKKFVKYIDELHKEPAKAQPENIVKHM